MTWDVACILGGAFMFGCRFISEGLAALGESIRLKKKLALDVDVSALDIKTTGTVHNIPLGSKVQKS